MGCQDLDICKKFASTACMVRWVRETCKSKCSQCGYGKLNTVGERKLEKRAEYQANVTIVEII